MLSKVVTNQVGQQRENQQEVADTSRVREFLRMNPPSFTGKANVVDDALSRLSMGSTTHFEEDKKELAKDVHRLARLGVQLFDSTKGGVVVMNGVESSLVSEVKEKQDQDPILLELKVNVHKQKVMAFEQGGDGVFRYQGPDLVDQAMEKMRVIQERLKTMHSHQKSYTDDRRRDLEFEVDDWVYLKVSPMKGVMRFGKKGKLSPRYIGPYRISKRIGNVAYELELP
ncbi:hypothetical protein MTR67_026005 [Solanum verrucosum]|uniref:Tf2-1-like SH3-like domain-containing protein n=1 Tax=Solanum verrucosum TaxID=315347 RepID=A0AAF0TZ14_SOLVR|nr:hypothetical protein MTR67_026005 [Solanum verrucosum]